jgi:hypothetical protein
MKTYQFTEFWYALLIGLADCLVAVPVGYFSYASFTAGGHDAALGWLFAIVAILLWSWAFCCCGWEILLLHRRRAEQIASETVPAVVFCSGLTTLILALGITIKL